VKPETLRNLFVLEVAVFFAMLCAEMAGFLMLSVVERYLDAVQSWHAHEIPIAVAAHRIGVGDTIDSLDLRTVEFPKDFVDQNALIDPAQVIGKVAREPILAGEMVRSERLADPDRGQGLDALLPTGMRASSLVLDGAARVAGQIEPGDHVDVIATLFEEHRPTETQTVLQGVEVLAVEQHVDHTRTLSQRYWAQVTFAVTPDQA